MGDGFESTVAQQEKMISVDILTPSESVIWELAL